MYSRSITIPPKKLVENNKAYFGSFAELPPSIDIIGLETPFGGFPLPSFLTKLRIRSNFSHICFSENYTIVLGILDAKIFAYSEIVVWNNKTGWCARRALRLAGIHADEKFVDIYPLSIQPHDNIRAQGHRGGAPFP